MAVAEQENADYEVILYMETPPSRDRLRELVDKLEGPVEDLVRKDGVFKELGLRAEDYVGDPGAVVDLLSRHIELMQRPVLVRGERVIIGRPKERVADFLR